MVMSATAPTIDECPDGTCPLKPANAKRVSSTLGCRTCGGGPKRKLVGQTGVPNVGIAPKPTVTRAITVPGPVHQVPVRTVMPEPVMGPRTPSATSLLAAPVSAKVFNPANPGNPHDLTRVRPTGPIAVLATPSLVPEMAPSVKIVSIRTPPDAVSVPVGMKSLPRVVEKGMVPPDATVSIPSKSAPTSVIVTSDVPSTKVTSAPSPMSKDGVVPPLKVTAPLSATPDYCSGPLASEEICRRGGDGSFPALSSECAARLRTVLAQGRPLAEIREDELCGPEFRRLIAARAATAAATGKMPEPVAAPVKIVAPGGDPVTVDALACLRSFLTMPVVSQAMIAGTFSNYPSGAMFASDLAYGNASAAADFVEWFGAAFADQPAEVARLCASVMNLRGVAAAGAVVSMQNYTGKAPPIMYEGVRASYPSTIYVRNMPPGGNVFIDGALTPISGSQWVDATTWAVPTNRGVHNIVVRDAAGNARRANGITTGNVFAGDERSGAVLDWNNMRFDESVKPGGAVFGQPYVQPRVRAAGDAVSDWEVAAGFRQGGPGTAQDTALQPQPGSQGPSSAEIINGVSRIGTVGLGVLNNYLDSESRSHIAEVMAQASSTNEATRQAANIEIARIQSEAQVRIAALGPNATPQQQQYALNGIVSSGATDNTALYVGLGVGGVALAAGAVLLLRSRK